MDVLAAAAPVPMAGPRPPLPPGGPRSAGSARVTGDGARSATSGSLKKRVTARALQRKDLRSAKVEDEAQKNREELEKARKIPLDLLAAEWMKVEVEDVPTRVYLVEKCLPTLVLALEKLLQEIEKRDLVGVSEVAGTGLNPVNFLAQYLMRNNPRFSNFAEASPYMMSMRVVEQELRDRMYATADDRKARVRAEVVRRREETQKQEQLRMEDARARLAPVLDSVPKWRFPDADHRQGVPRAQLYPALLRFADSQRIKRRPRLGELPFSEEVNVAVTFPQLRSNSFKETGFMDSDQLLRVLGPLTEAFSAEAVEKLGEYLADTFKRAPGTESPTPVEEPSEKTTTTDTAGSTGEGTLVADTAGESAAGATADTSTGGAEGSVTESGTAGGEGESDVQVRSESPKPATLHDSEVPATAVSVEEAAAATAPVEKEQEEDATTQVATSVVPTVTSQDEAQTAAVDTALLAPAQDAEAPVDTSTSQGETSFAEVAPVKTTN